MNPNSASLFSTTRWTQVLNCRGDGPEARIALADLCAAYWNPIFRFLVAEGKSEDDARELTQEFVARLLAGNGIDGADPRRGRFRSYLLGALKHFLSDNRKHALALRRSAGNDSQTLTTIEFSVETEAGPDSIPLPSIPATSDEYFDRQWALAVLERALKAVENEYEQNGRTNLFRDLQAYITPVHDDLSQRDLANKLGITEGALKVAIHRLRHHNGE